MGDTVNQAGKTHNYCLVTVTTSDYVVWTMTMVHSFLRSNTWFKGDLVILCHNLSAEETKMFSIFPSIRFVSPSEPLLSAIQRLCDTLPAFNRMAPMFYSLEAFNLEGYRKVLFLDSDMVVTATVEELFAFDGPLRACAESCWYQGKGRRADTYEAVEICHDPGLFIKNPVNSGCMMIDGTLIVRQNYLDMVSMVEPGLWSKKNTFHADQLIINLYFREQISLMDARYNYRPTNAHEILEKDGTSFDDAKIIHYFRQYKPWNFDEVFALSQQDMVHLRAFRLWYQCFVDLLKFNHLQQKIQLLKNGTTHP